MTARLASPRLVALGQILLVVAPFALWLILAQLFGLGVAGVLPPAIGPIVHVALTGLVALGLVAVALRHEADMRRVLGLEPMRVSAAIGWGLAGVVAAYVADSLAVAAYMAIARADLDAELSAKARWTTQLGGIPLAAIVPLSVFVGIYEEIVFRGFLLDRLRLLSGSSTLAVLGSSILFALGHLYQGSLGLVQTGMVGLVLGALAVARGSIWPCIVAHVTIDTFGLFALHVLRPELERMLHHPP